MKVMKNNPRCYINRLRKLADFLEELPPKVFDFGKYAEPASYIKPVKVCGKVCNTVACAIGWAPSIPQFRRLGVKLRTVETDYGFKLIVPSLDGRDADWEEISERLFGLDINEHEQVFMPGRKINGYSGLKGNATAITVAKHIRKFCDLKQKELGL